MEPRASETKGYLSPEAPRAIAMDMLRRALALLEAEASVGYNMAHPPQGLSDDVVSKRNALLGLTEQLLRKDADREMDKAVQQWKIYKEMSK